MKRVRPILFGTIALAIFTLIITTMHSSTASADTIGPNNPASGVDTSGIGSVSWQNAGNISQPDGAYASTLMIGNVTTHYLLASQYGFAIPPDATILGIELTINRWVSDHNAGLMDNVVRLVKAGAITGDNKSSSSLWTTTSTPVTYGSPTDLWGDTWTPADINDLNFGAVISVIRTNNGNSNRTADVDSMQIKVYYAYDSTLTLNCGNGSPVVYGESVTCTATVSRLVGSQTPDGSVTWSTDGSGSFEPNPCSLSGTDGVSSCTAAYTPSSVGTGQHTITASYNGGRNFLPETTSVVVPVSQRVITVTADPQTKVFGSPDPDLTYTYTPVLAFKDTFFGLMARVTGENVGQYAITQGSLSLNENYDLIYIGSFLEITPAAAQCTVTPYTITYDGSTHTATGTCLGLSGEALSGLDLMNTTHIDAGIYTDDWNFNDSTGNYADQTGQVVDTINKAEATCSVIPYSVDFDGAAHTVTGNCTGKLNESLTGLDLSGTIHTNAGTYTDSWSFSNANYFDQDGTVDDKISKVNANCTVNGWTGTYDGAAHGATGECLALDGSSLEGLDRGNTFTNVPGGTAEWMFTDVSGNYNDQNGSVEITIGKANASCTVSGWTGTYDGESHGATGACLGVDGLALEGLDLGSTFINVPGGTVDWTFTDGSGNYNDLTGSVEIAIAKADAKCTIMPYSLEFDKLAHTAAGSCKGVNGEYLNGLDLSATTHTNVGSYPEDAWTFNDITGNYNDTGATVADEITKRMITVTADAKSKSIKKPDPLLTYSITSGSLLEGDAFSGTLSRLPGEAPGRYAILLGTLTLPDYYQITFVGADLTIIGNYYYYPLIFKN